MVLEATREVVAVLANAHDAERIKALASNVRSFVLHEKEASRVPRSLMCAHPCLAIRLRIDAGLVGITIGSSMRRPAPQKHGKRFVFGSELGCIGHFLSPALTNVSELHVLKELAPQARSARRTSPETWNERGEFNYVSANFPMKKSDLHLLHVRLHRRATRAAFSDVLELDDGDYSAREAARPIVRQRGSGFTQPISDWTDLSNAHDRAQIHINERTAATKWRGESVDYGLAVQVLLQQSRRPGERDVCRMGLAIARRGER